MLATSLLTESQPLPTMTMSNSNQSEDCRTGYHTLPLKHQIRSSKVHRDVGHSEEGQPGHAASAMHTILAHNRAPSSNQALTQPEIAQTSKSITFLLFFSLSDQPHLYHEVFHEGMDYDEHGPQGRWHPSPKLPLCTVVRQLCFNLRIRSRVLIGYLIGACIMSRVLICDLFETDMLSDSFRSMGRNL